MITLRNDTEGFIITLDDTDDDLFKVSATDELKDELQDDLSMLEEFIEQKKRTVEAFVEDADQSPSNPTIEDEVARRLQRHGYEIVAKTDVVQSIDDDDGGEVVF